MSTRSKNNVHHAHLFIEVSVPCQKSSKVMYMCVRGINFASFSVIFLLDLETIKLFLFCYVNIIIFFFNILTHIYMYDILSKFFLCLSDNFYKFIFVSFSFAMHIILTIQSFFHCYYATSKG